MTRLLSLLFFSALAAVSFAAAPSLKTLRRRSAGTLSNVLRLTTSNYTSTILEGPREYASIVLFTATEARFGCVPCQPAASEFLIASKSYAKHHGVPLGRNGTSHDEGADQRRLFFFVVDYKFNSEAFAIHGFNNVPFFVAFPPTTKKANPMAHFKSGQTLPVHEVGGEMLLDYDGKVKADAILRMSYQHLQSSNVEPTITSVKIIRPASERYSYALLATVVAALFVAAVFIDPSNALIWKKSWFWLFASIFLYSVSISGSVGALIKNPPWYGRTQSGGIALFPSSAGGGGGERDQYILGGMLIAALNVTAALAVIALVTAAKADNKDGSNSLRYFSRVVICVLSIAVFIASYSRILEYYMAETRWYNINTILGPAKAIAMMVYNNWFRLLKQATTWSKANIPAPVMEVLGKLTKNATMLVALAVEQGLVGLEKLAGLVQEVPTLLGPATAGIASVFSTLFGGAAAVGAGAGGIGGEQEL